MPVNLNEIVRQQNLNPGIRLSSRSPGSFVNNIPGARDIKGEACRINRQASSFLIVIQTDSVLPCTVQPLCRGRTCTRHSRN